MNNLSTYIIEKLHLNKNIETSLNDKEYNTHIDMWFASDNIYRVRDYVHDNTNAIRFGISKIKADGDNTLYKIEVENRHDFLHIIILVLKFIYNFNNYKDNIKDIEKERWECYLDNFKEIKELIYTFSNKEIKDAYDEEIK